VVNRNTFLGIILIIIGFAWTLSNLHLINDHWILPFIGIVFLAAYFYRGSAPKKGTIGFLIAGCIIFMVGLFAALNDSLNLGAFEGGLFFFFVGMAFLPVYFIHTRYLQDKNSGNQKWPLYTGLIIIAFGVFVLITETAHLPLLRKIYPIIWPMAIIVLGLLVILKGGKKED